MDPGAVIESTGDPALAIDGQGLVVASNRAAAELLGHTADQIVGRPCHEILCGRDLFGNRYCSEECATRSMAASREPVRQFLLELTRKDGTRIPARVSVLAVPQPAGGPLLIHLFFPLAATDTPQIADVLGPGGIPRRHPLLTEILTPREIEILRLLASGVPSREIAASLFISLPTVRTHIQNILRKLEVHSQVEAVALAFRSGLA